MKEFWNELKEYWYFLTGCWAVFRADRAWRDGLIQYAMMAEEDDWGEDVDAVEVSIVVVMSEGYAVTITKRYDLEED